jgi:hypothetical protein
MLNLILTILSFIFYGSLNWKGLAMVDTIRWYDNQRKEDQRKELENQNFRRNLQEGVKPSNDGTYY